jgi:hypothetical protein
MTKKIAISVPDDVAERLEREPNVSAFITESVRRRMVGERVRQLLRSAGFDITEEDIAAARRERERIQAAITPELRAKAARLAATLPRRRP